MSCNGPCPAGRVSDSQIQNSISPMDSESSFECSFVPPRKTVSPSPHSTLYSSFLLATECFSADNLHSLYQLISWPWRNEAVYFSYCSDQWLARLLLEWDHCYHDQQFLTTSLWDNVTKVMLRCSIPARWHFAFSPGLSVQQISKKDGQKYSPGRRQPQRQVDSAKDFVLDISSPLCFGV